MWTGHGFDFGGKKQIDSKGREVLGLDDVAAAVVAAELEDDAPESGKCLLM